MAVFCNNALRVFSLSCKLSMTCWKAENTLINNQRDWWKKFLEPTNESFFRFRVVWPTNFWSTNIWSTRYIDGLVDQSAGVSAIACNNQRLWSPGACRPIHKVKAVPAKQGVDEMSVGHIVFYQKPWQHFFVKNSLPQSENKGPFTCAFWAANFSVCFNSFCCIFSCVELRFL